VHRGGPLLSQQRDIRTQAQHRPPWRQIVVERRGGNVGREPRPHASSKKSRKPET